MRAFLVVSLRKHQAEKEVIVRSMAPWRRHGRWRGLGDQERMMKEDLRRLVHVESIGGRSTYYMHQWRASSLGWTIPASRLGTGRNIDCVTPPAVHGAPADSTLRSALATKAALHVVGSLAGIKQLEPLCVVCRCRFGAPRKPGTLRQLLTKHSIAVGRKQFVARGTSQDEA